MHDACFAARRLLRERRGFGVSAQVVRLRGKMMNLPDGWGMIGIHVFRIGGIGVTIAMPSLFVAGGVPEHAGEDIAYARFVRRLGSLLPRPRAIVAVSPHWESALQQIGAALRPALGRAAGGASAEPVLIDVALPLEIARLLEQEGIACAIDETRALDGSLLQLLTLLFPAAEFPVVALSVNPKRAPEEHYRIGQALAELRCQGVLVVGSGSAPDRPGLMAGGGKLMADGGGKQVTDGGKLMPDGGKPVTDGGESVTDGGEPMPDGGKYDEGGGAVSGGSARAQRFDEWLAEQLETWNLAALFDCERRAPYGGEALPASGRWATLLLAMGAADAEQRALRLYRSDRFAPLRPGCWMFGAAEQLAAELEEAFDDGEAAEGWGGDLDSGEEERP